MKKIKNTHSTNFLISIYHQDNFSYQGEIHWLDTGKKLRFRSELELLNLIHEAAKTMTVETDTLRTWDDDQTLSVL